MSQFSAAATTAIATFRGTRCLSLSLPLAWEMLLLLLDIFSSKQPDQSSLVFCFLTINFQDGLLNSKLSPLDSNYHYSRRQLLLADDRAGPPTNLCS